MADGPAQFMAGENPPAVSGSKTPGAVPTMGGVGPVPHPVDSSGLVQPPGVPLPSGAPREGQILRGGRKR